MLVNLSPHNYIVQALRLKLLFIVIFAVCYPQQSFSQRGAIETSGDVILLALPATALTGSLLIKDYEGTGQFAKGFFLNQVFTFSLKGIIGKERPNGDGFDSFPSGHTSTTFQGAAFIQRRYGWKYGLPAYLLAGWTGYSRIEADRHDIADVLAGAALGVACSYLFTKPYEKQNYQVTLTGDLDSIRIGFNYRF